MSEGSPQCGNEQATEPGPDMSARQSRVIDKRCLDASMDATSSTAGSHVREFTLSGRRPAGVELSQPPARLTHVERLRWLQTRRTTAGLWVACDNKQCNKFRFLKDAHDPMQLPDKWYCRMNPDGRYATCEAPEVTLSVAAEEDMLHAVASAGSVVWARMRGFPRWPALVDDDPDTEQYYWLDDFSDIPTYYHVVFFDEPNRPVERAWVAAGAVRRYEAGGGAPGGGRAGRRLAAAARAADAALALPVAERLRRFAFVARYCGAINSPRTFTRRQLAAYGHFSDESSADSSDDDGAAAPSPVPIEVSGSELTVTAGAETVTPPPPRPSPPRAGDSTELYTMRSADTRISSELNELTREALAECSTLTEQLSTRARKDSGSDDFDFQ